VTGSEERNGFLFYTTKGKFFIYSSVQPLSTYFTQGDPKEAGISRSEWSLLKHLLTENNSS